MFAKLPLRMRLTSALLGMAIFAPSIRADEISDLFKKRVNSVVFIVAPEKGGGRC